MNKNYGEGDLVRVTSGVYKDAEGVVDDIIKECSVIRIHANEGIVFADADAVEVIPPVKTKALLKR
jgi:transcription antitermination factor NusG